MKTDKKADPVLIVGLALPVVMIAIIAAVITASRSPNEIEDPGYDFIYGVGYSLEYHHFIKDGRLQREKRMPEIAETVRADSPQLRFFVHNVTENASRPVSFDRASSLSLDPSEVSPDGFRVDYGRKNELLPMFSHSDFQTRYLRKEGYSKRLRLEIGDGFGYAHNMAFLGWIEE